MGARGTYIPVKCRYNAVQFIMISCTALQKQWQKINKILKSQQTAHIWSSWASYGVSFVNIVDKINSIIMALHCIWNSISSPFKYPYHIPIRHKEIHMCYGVLHIHLWTQIWSSKFLQITELLMVLCHQQLQSWQQSRLAIKIFQMKSFIDHTTFFKTTTRPWEFWQHFQYLLTNFIYWSSKFLQGHILPLMDYSYIVIFISSFIQVLYLQEHTLFY